MEKDTYQRPGEARQSFDSTRNVTAEILIVRQELRRTVKAVGQNRTKIRKSRRPAQRNSRITNMH